MAIVIRTHFDCTVEESIVESNGKYIMLQVLIGGELALLIDIYALNRDNEPVTFYRSLFKTIAKIIWMKLKILLLE